MPEQNKKIMGKTMIGKAEARTFPEKRMRHKTTLSMGETASF